MSKPLHFGYLNNNPGNVRPSKAKWLGQVDPPYIPSFDKTRAGFLRFSDATYGLRCIAKTLMYYQDKLGVTTIAGAFHKYAPHGDGPNNPSAYAAQVAAAAGVSPTEPVDLHRYDILRAMLPAICRIETGQPPPYTDAVYDKALIMAGVEAPRKPLAKTGTVKGAQTATVGTAVTATSEILPAADLPTWGQLLLPYVKWLGIALILIGLGYVVWRRFDDRRKGLR